MSGASCAPQVIAQIWPYLSMIMENKFREKLEPKIREKSAHLRTFAFTKLYFGQKVSLPGSPPLGPPAQASPCPRPSCAIPPGSQEGSGEEEQTAGLEMVLLA